MVLLKALQLPSLTPHVLSFLAGQRIVTVEDFLVHDLQKLAAAAEEGLVPAEFKQAVADVLDYLESVQDGWRSGSEIFHEVRRFLPINCESVDLLLHGGLLEGTVTELVGASSTGKSQAAASVAYQHPSAVVVYVDTGRTFSAKRVAHILGGFLGAQAKIVEHEDDLALSMRSIRRIGVLDIFCLLSLLHRLLKSLESKSQHPDELSYLRLLIIDSASAVIAPVLGGSHARGHALMASVGQTLKKLAVVNRVAVLITNHTVTGDEGHIKPALGESWLSVPHIRLWLARASNTDACTISLIKHTSLVCGGSPHGTLCPSKESILAALWLSGMQYAGILPYRHNWPEVC